MLLLLSSLSTEAIHCHSQNRGESKDICLWFIYITQIKNFTVTLSKLLQGLLEISQGIFSMIAQMSSLLSEVRLRMHTVSAQAPRRLSNSPTQGSNGRETRKLVWTNVSPRTTNERKWF